MWEDFWSSTRAVDLTEVIGQRAGELAGKQALRGADAVHLASALAMDSTDVLFAVWNLRLRAGAQAAGVTTVPEQDRP